MNSIGKRVPPSPKPRMCNGGCDPKKRVMKGKSLCSQCELDAAQRTTKAQAAAAAK